MQGFAMPSSFSWYIIAGEGDHISIQDMVNQVAEFLFIHNLREMGFLQDFDQYSSMVFGCQYQIEDGDLS